MERIRVHELQVGDRILCAGKPEVIVIEARPDNRVAVLLSDGREMVYGAKSAVGVERL